MDVVFGPIISRRFGISLGIDLSVSKKQCNFDCVYCELKASKQVDFQDSITSMEDILKDIESNLKKHEKIDVLTFTANGEPTLYPHLKELIIESKKLLKPYSNVKTLILSNGSRFGECKEALVHFDMVKFSLDALDSKTFKRIDKPSKSLDIDKIKSGIESFSKIYQGELIAEILIVKDINDNPSQHIESAKFLSSINVSRLDISTIDRPSSHRVYPVSSSTLYEIAEVFENIPVCVVMRKEEVLDIVKMDIDESEILHTLYRRPLSEFDVDLLYSDDTKERLKQLESDGKVFIREISGVRFYDVRG